MTALLRQMLSVNANKEDIIGLLAFLAGQIPKWEKITLTELAGMFQWEKVPKDDVFLPESIYG